MAAYGKFAKYYDKLMYDCDYATWSQYLLQLLAERGVTAGEGLDLACGSGRIMAALAGAGFRVTGVDLSREMLNEAVNNCRGKLGRIVLAEGDMARFKSLHPVDFITAVCDGVNYLNPQKDFPAFLRSCSRNLKRGGVLLFDISSEYKLAEVLGNNIFADDTDEVTYLWQNDLADDHVDMELIFFVKEAETYYKFTEQHRMYRYAVAEVERALAENGFIKIEKYNCLTKDAPGDHTQRIQFAAVKG